MAQKTNKNKGSLNGGSVKSKFSDSKNGGAAKEDERVAKRRAAALASFEAAYNNHNKTR